MKTGNTYEEDFLPLRKCQKKFRSPTFPFLSPPPSFSLWIKPFQAESSKKMSINRASNCSFWSKEQNKAFENALPIYFGDCDQWEKIMAVVPGKTLEDVKDHYKLLVDDVKAIESGHVPLPCYDPSFNESSNHAGDIRVSRKDNQFGKEQSDSSHGKKSSKLDQERRKGIAWTEEEHRLFLQGLEKYGKGDWRSISRNVVVTRTPTQVASHAQKYFIRLNSVNKERRRSSIHDITSVDDGNTSAPQKPIPELKVAAAAAGSTETVKSSQFITRSVGVYTFPTVDQPSHTSAVGTSMCVPSPAPTVLSFRALPPEAYVPGVPKCMAPMKYPMP